MTGAMSTVVKSNTAIPCRHTETFTTHVDYGSCVSIDIYEGETVVVKENNFLGTFVLRGIPPLRAGIPKIEVTFDLDANGILHVIAMDQGVGHSRDIITNDEENLSREELIRMVSEAERYRKEDEKQRDQVAAKNDLESYIFRLKSAAS
jgi:heat shock protein 1/8